MLTFRFDQLASRAKEARRQKQDSVRVGLDRVMTEAGRWSFDIGVENPPGGPQFESYQSWLLNNRIWLEKGEGKNRQVFIPDPADEEQLEAITVRRAAIRYHFVERPGTPRLGNLEDWTLVYRTPGPIVEVEVPYVFRDVPLP